MNRLYGDNPCKECEYRRPGCHSDCEQHRQWKEELNERKTQITSERIRENQLDSFEKKRMKRSSKRRT